MMGHLRRSGSGCRPVQPRFGIAEAATFCGRGERDKLFAAAKEETAGRLVSYGATTRE